MGTAHGLYRARARCDRLRDTAGFFAAVAFAGLAFFAAVAGFAVVAGFAAAFAAVAFFAATGCAFTGAVFAGARFAVACAERARILAEAVDKRVVCDPAAKAVTEMHRHRTKGKKCWEIAIMPDPSEAPFGAAEKFSWCLYFHWLIGGMSRKIRANFRLLHFEIHSGYRRVDWTAAGRSPGPTPAFHSFQLGISLLAPASKASLSLASKPILAPLPAVV